MMKQNGCRLLSDWLTLLLQRFPENVCRKS